VALARAGWEVVVTDICRDEPGIPYPLSRPFDLEETARLVARTGRRCASVEADAASQSDMETAVRRACELGDLDVVCANAGVISFGRSWELTQEQWDLVLRTNLTGVWATCRAAVPLLIERGRGAIVVVGSTAAIRGFPGISHYSAAKHGVVGLVRALAAELAPHGVRVNCVLPGGVRTPMASSAAMQGWLAAEPDAARALTAMIATDLVEPDDVSAAVVWLATEQARFVTGALLPVDAGTHLR
jgi:NAD(P)-dependent dehydrogenase (short-subunit alcohol dehydrogenase family)